MNCFPFIVVCLFSMVLFSSGCKKSEIETPAEPFEIRVDGKKMVMDSVVYRMVYANNLSSALHSIFAYSRSTKSSFFISFENTKDTTLLGSYPVSTDIMQSRVRDFSLILNFGSSFTDVFYYNKVEKDFGITITGKRAYHISGSSKGSITGGNPVPGGFTFGTITNVRTVPVEIDFDTPFYKP